MMSVSPAVAPSHSTIQTLHFSPRSLNNNTQNAVASSSKLTGSTGSADGKADSVSSLREAALSTLKSKRRKLHNGASSARPAAPPSVQLDYGSNLDSTEDMPIIVKLPTLNATNQSTEAPKDDHREEGEISDEESELSSSAQRISLRDRIASPFRPLKRSHPSSSRSSLERSDHRLSTQPYSDTFKSHTPPVTTPGPHTVHGSTNIPLGIDENHVRPGLPMTFSQYTQAKKTVLDLLGWGVHPEYLVDCGISREAVFYVFTELNLRLPQNLDTSGISRFEPPFFSTSDEESSASRPFKSTDVLSSVNPSTPSQTAAVDNSVDQPLSTVADLAPNLHDIEAQRRQQLLARKAAVIASIKPRIDASGVQLSTLPAATTTVTPDVILSREEEASLTPVTPDTVDDFLKTIGGSSNDSVATIEEKVLESTFTSSIVKQPEPLRPSAVKPPTMDLDEIPGLGPVNQPSTSILQSASTQQSMSVQHTDSSSRSSTIPENFAVPKLPNDTVALPSSIASAPSSRRNGKRPVASDFADFDSVPSSPSMPPRPASAQFNGSAPLYIRRKQLGPFANVSAPRRYVIEWSDSEDDSGGDPGAASAKFARTEFGKPPIRDSKEARFLARYSVQSSQRGTPTGTPTPDPSASTSLELEIKRMKEMIAERERKMKKNQAATSKPPTPPEPVDATPSIVTSAVSRQNSQSSMTSANEASEVSSAMTISPIDTTPNGMDEDQEMRPSAESDGLDNIAIDSGIPSTSLNSETHATAEEQSVPEMTTQSTVQQPQRQTTPQPNELPSNSTSSMEIVDDSEASSSAKVSLSQPHIDTSFSAYHSVFDSYPLLRSRQNIKSRQAPTSDANSSSSTFFISGFTPATNTSTNLGDIPSNNTQFLERLHSALRPLSVTVALRRAAEDPQLQICQYEVPGGGQCRDATCKDLHLNDLEPSDQETAQYLCGNVFSQYSVSDVFSALQSARVQKQKQGLPYHERVAMAVLALTNGKGK